VILCINKWDLITSGKRKEFEQNVRDRLKFLDYAPMVFHVRLNATGINELFELIKRVNESAFHRVTTGELNRFVETLKFEERKVLYITQASVRPPSFILFTDKAGPLHFSHERYLTNQTPQALRIRRNADSREDPGARPQKRPAAAKIAKPGRPSLCLHGQAPGGLPTLHPGALVNAALSAAGYLISRRFCRPPCPLQTPINLSCYEANP